MALILFIWQICWKLAQGTNGWCYWSWPYWISLCKNDGDFPIHFSLFCYMLKLLLIKITNWFLSTDLA